MKKILLILFTFNLSFLSGHSQTIENPMAKVIYVAKKETSHLGLYECTLIFDNQQSIFVWNKDGDSALRTNASGSLYKPDHSKDGVINILNFKNNSLISKDFISYDKNSYLIKEEIPNIDWKITGETKQLSGYTVTKATTSFRGRDYTVWFTTKIPTKAGPWKLHGLPGLILEVVDSTNEIYFSVKKIEQFNQSFSVEKEFTGKNIDLITFYKKNINAPFEAVAKQNARSKRGGSVQITGVNFNFLEKSFEYLAEEREKEVNNKN